MVSVRYYLDTRSSSSPTEEAPLKLAIRKRHEGAFLGTGVRLRPEHWDAKAQRVKGHSKRAALNSFLDGFRFQVDSLIRDLILDGTAADLTAKQLKDICAERFYGKRDCVTLGQAFEAAMRTEGLSENTLNAYRSTLANIVRFDPHITTRPIRSISEQWVEDFLAHLVRQGCSANTRAVYIGRIRRVFSLAKKAGQVNGNPATGIRVKPSASRHRDLTAGQMRLLLTAPCEDDKEQVSTDFFAFSFLCRAANTKDIYSFTPENIYNGRIYYQRAKTGKEYSIRIEPELQALLDRYADGKRLFSPAGKYRRTASFLTAMNSGLRKKALRIGLPDITTYFARHTFASVAFRLGYGMDLVSAALGHALGGARVTSTYVSIRDSQVDDLARAVYDAVLLPHPGTPATGNGESR